MWQGCTWREFPEGLRRETDFTGHEGAGEGRVRMLFKEQWRRETEFIEMGNRQVELAMLGGW